VLAIKMVSKDRVDSLIRKFYLASVLSAILAVPPLYALANQESPLREERRKLFYERRDMLANLYEQHDKLYQKAFAFEDKHFAFTSRDFLNDPENSALVTTVERLYERRRFLEARMDEIENSPEYDAEQKNDIYALLGVFSSGGSLVFFGIARLLRYSKKEFCENQKLT